MLLYNMLNCRGVDMYKSNFNSIGLIARSFSLSPCDVFFSISGIKTSMPQNDLVILHFNDVYNLEPQKEEPVGGAARFVSCVKSYQSLNPLVLFSGDVLNPSLCKYFKIWGK